MQTPRAAEDTPGMMPAQMAHAAAVHDEADVAGAAADQSRAEFEYAEELWAAEPLSLEEELPFANDESDDEEADAYYFILSRPAPGGDIYQASRVGDVERLRYLLEHDCVDVNVRDRWDSVPLYYACLAGHYEVAELLLENGAICNEFTFDGDRCHYASLTTNIRALLRRYEARPPPLSPLAAALRSVCVLCSNADAPEADAPRPTYADIVFVLHGERIPLHRALLAARSPYLRKMLLSAWLPSDGSPRMVNLRNDLLTPETLKALLVYIYTERLDISMDDAPLMRKVAHKARCRELEAAIQREMYTMRYYFKSTRRNEVAPRRFVLQPGSMPVEAQLSTQLTNLRTWAAHLEATKQLGPGRDFADILLAVGGSYFRCHRVVLATRSEYFKTLLQRAEAAELAGGPASSRDETQLPVLELHGVSGVSADVFEVMLHFIYANRLSRLGTRWHTSAAVEALFDAADAHLLIPMKRSVAEEVLENIEEAMRAGAKPALEHLCRLLLAADQHNVAGLRDSCLAAIAHHFDALAAAAAAAAAEAPERDVSVFTAFVQAIAPHVRTADDITEDAADIAGASRGDIEGGGIGGLGVQTIVQDLREAYLEGKFGAARDAFASKFDEQLLRFVALA